MTIVRVATLDDAKPILDIYSPYILQTAFTFETVVPTVDEFRARMEKYLQKYPWLVAEFNGRLVGYVYGSVHRDREAYQWTCECSVYVHDDFKGKGIGSELYVALFSILKMQGYRNVYAGITMPNEASERMHQKSGFEKFAEYNNIGCKFGNWYNVGWWRLRLNDHEINPTAPLHFNKMSRPVYEGLLHQAARNIAANLMSSYTG